MNKDFKSLDQKFMPLTEAELVEVEGGWVGGDLVRAVFDIGREVGRTVRGLAVRAYGRIRSRIGSGSGSSNGGGTNNGGGADQGIFN
ncbi:hypothetical protein [Streptococcus cristatus]|uniref:Uncharacterized protein n=1 Tax=Streptococcus cristatus TaxID=45634 RepID=A0A139N3W3_STRCR|nr:hypothetical protein [Streptococcus cristatus]KXT70718.1 hypothetical protein SCRDD08_00478 [Streptococcus cristatus]